MKPKLSLQLDLFYEEEGNPTYLDTLGKHFDVEIVKDTFILDYPSKQRLQPCFRTSLTVALVAGYKFEFSNCMKWVPHFREHLLDPQAYFNELGYFEGKYVCGFFPKFLRPCCGQKTFAGRVFKSKADFDKECNFLHKNLNVGRDLMCMCAEPRLPSKEYRLIFVNGEFVSGSQYMTEGEKDVTPEVPKKVIVYGKHLASHPFFANVFNFVIDVGEQQTGSLHMIECNSFECSSFYGADMDAIYGAWAASLKN